MHACECGLGSSGMTVEVERQCAKDMKVWSAVVHM